MINTLKTMINSQPKALYFLLSAEIPELMGRFGIMATLVLYLTNSLHMTDGMAFTVYSTFLILSYMTPILGGFLADRVLGYKISALMGSCLMIIGNLLLIYPNLLFIYTGLSIIALGIGFFSPALIALVNALYTNKKEGRDQAFVLYYIARNVGALIAPTLCGIIGLIYGYNLAFVFTAICMAIGTLVFFKGQSTLPSTCNNQITTISNKIPCNYINCLLSPFYKKPLLNSLLLSVLLIPILIIAFIFHLSSLFLAIGAIITSIILLILFKNSSNEHRQALAVILIAITSIVLFLSVDQLCGASFNLFVERLVNRTLLGITLPTSVFFSINPLFMIIFGGVLMALINTIKNPNPIIASFTKITLAFFIFAIAMLLFVFASNQAHKTGQASYLYIIISYCLCALAELCIMPIVIALIGKLSPYNKIGLMMGIYQFGSAIASFITGKLAGMGGITFTIQSFADKQRAAVIYHHLFSNITIALLIVGIVFFALNTLIQIHNRSSNYITLKPNQYTQRIS